ncbi:MAG: 4Fe-4S binding protein [Candidatus Hydrogenedentes bacterium]|nr:4Fe-4S binding protein [Candidatus Hydrogenedentota bacterium]
MSAQVKRRRNPLAQYFADIWAGIVTTYAGMRLTLGYFFSKPVTLRYPEQRPVIPPTHRGIHTYDEDSCTICRRCAMVCPVDCIDIETVGRGKDQLMLHFRIDYARCLFCNLCAEGCQSSGLKLTEGYNLATGSRALCVRELARPKTEEEIQAVKDRIAQKDAEKAAKAAREALDKKAKEQQEGTTA